MRVLAYRDLEDELVATILGLEGIENGRQLIRVELDCINCVSDRCTRCTAGAVLLWWLVWLGD